jgi:hypothetical protein
MGYVPVKVFIIFFLGDIVTLWIQQDSLFALVGYNDSNPSLY